jgi:hypothetical protein
LASNNTQRISFENWAWLEHKGWTGAAWDEGRQAALERFVRHQRRVRPVSLPDGLVQLCDRDRATDDRPERAGELHRAGVAARDRLSQAAYVAGKIAAPPSFGALDAKITELRKAQDEFLATTASIWVSPPAAPATALGTAKLAAQDKDKYVEFHALAVEAKEMFNDLFKEKGSTPNLEPDP